MAMPTIPSAETIRARILADIEGAFNQQTPANPKSFNRMIAGALSGLFVLAYHAIMWVYAQIFPDRADWQSLILLGKLVRITPTPAVAALLTANVFGTDGESVLEGTRFIGPNGLVYQVSTGAQVIGGYAECQLKCLSAGEAGNLADGEELSIVTADVALTGKATVTGTVTTGADAESLERFRSRVVARYKKRFTGGSPADYQLWGLETPHFYWVSPYASLSRPGEIIVYGKVDNQPDGIPTSAQLAELLQYLTYDPESGKRYRKPTTDEIECRPISRYAFDVTIRIKNSTPALKANIENAVAEYLDSLEPYNEGVSDARVDAVTNSGIAAEAFALAQEAGATVLQVVVQEAMTGSTITNYVLYGGEHAKLGTLTFEDIT